MQLIASVPEASLTHQLVFVPVSSSAVRLVIPGMVKETGSSFETNSEFVEMIQVAKNGKSAFLKKLSQINVALLCCIFIAMYLCNLGIGDSDAKEFFKVHYILLYSLYTSLFVYCLTAVVIFVISIYVVMYYCIPFKDRFRGAFIITLLPFIGAPFVWIFFVRLEDVEVGEVNGQARAQQRD